MFYSIAVDGFRSEHHNMIWCREEEIISIPAEESVLRERKQQEPHIPLRRLN